MIETVIKRDGRIEPFKPSKLNGWGEWAARALGPEVDWSSVVLDTVTNLPAQVSTSFLQQQLIKNCLQEDSWLYNRMPGACTPLSCTRRCTAHPCPPSCSCTAVCKSWATWNTWIIPKRSTCRSSR